MDTFEAIQNRRSVKHFDPEHSFNPNETRRLLEASMLSPTAFNMQNWRFVVVSNPGLRQDLRTVGYDQAQITDASLLVYVVMDRTAHSDRPERLLEGCRSGGWRADGQHDGRLLRRQR